MRQSAIQASRTTAKARAGKAGPAPRARSAEPNHRQAGPARDVATAVEHARTASRAALPGLPALARERALSAAGLEVHAGGAAADACAWLGARAFAVQNIVVFADTVPLAGLIRHELAHVAQQDGERRPAPIRYAAGSLALADPSGTAERDAREGGTVGGAAPVAVYRDPINPPDTDSDAATDDTLEPDPASPEAKVRFKTALKRLQALAEKQPMFRLTDTQTNDDTKFGVSTGGTGDDEQFDPVFQVSSPTPWRQADYIAAQTEVVSDPAARKDLTARIFPRSPASAGEPRGLDGSALALRAFQAAGTVLWAARVVSRGEAVLDNPDAVTTRYVFLGRYFQEGKTPEKGQAVTPGAVSVAGDLGGGKVAGVVSDKTGKLRKKPNPGDSLADYKEIVTKILAKTPAASKDARTASAQTLLETIDKAVAGPDDGKAAAAQQVRKDLADWVLAQYTDIDAFFTEIIQVTGFPQAWNPMKGDIQTRFIVCIAGQPPNPVTASARQVYFGAKEAGSDMVQRSPDLGALRRGDGYITASDGYHILESKARQGPPNDEEFEQMRDYRRIVSAPQIPGFLVENGQIKETLEKFSCVEYYLGITGSITKSPDDPMFQLADTWNTHLYRAFKQMPKDATGPVPKGEAGQARGYKIHPNVTGSEAKSTTIRINPLLSIPIAKPGEIDQSVTDFPNKTPGAKVVRADFKLARAFEAEIASGTIVVALDLGGAMQTPENPAPKPMKPVPAEEAKPAKPGGPVIYGQVENRFEKLGSSLDKFFKERIRTDAKLTDDGVMASVTVLRGPSGIPGITLDEAAIAVTYGARGLTAKGDVGLSNEKGTVKGTITVTWNSAAKNWKVVGTATFTDLIDGLKPIKATLTYDPANDITTIEADQVGIEKTYGAIRLTGTASRLKFDAKTGMFSGDADIKAALGAFGEASAKSSIADNRIVSATLTYTTPRLAYPKTNPAVAGELTGSVTYTAGKTPGDAPSFAGDIGVTAEIQAGPLKRLAKNGKLGIAGTVHIADTGAFSGSIGTTDELTLGEHFRIPPFQASVTEKGAFELAFSLEVVNIGALKDAKVSALINDKGFAITGANVQIRFGTDKDKVWGGLGVVYRQGAKGGELTVGGDINVRISEGLVAHGTATYDVDKETVSAVLSIDEITLLKYGPKEHTLVDFSKQVELISFYKVIGIYLDAGFALTFSYAFDLRLSPKVTLQDFSFKTFTFSSARALMRLMGEMVATLTGTPKIGLGVFVISTKLLRGGGGVTVPIVGRAALALDPPVTIEVTYTPGGGVSAGGTAGLSLLFGVSASIKPYAEFVVLDGAYEYKWTGAPLASFELLKERPIFTYMLNFGEPLHTETNPKIPTGPDAPAKAGGERSLVGKPTGTPTQTPVDTKNPAKQQEPEEKPKAKNEGGFDLLGMVSKLLDDPAFSGLRSILDAAGKVWDAITNFIGNIVKFIRNWVGGAIDVITRAIKGIGEKGLIGYIKDLLKERLNPALFYIIEPLLDELAQVEQDIYDLLDIKLPTSFTGLLEFGVDIIKKVLKLAWDGLGGLVKAMYKMISRLVDATRNFAQYLVDNGRLGVMRHERYIGIEGVSEHDFLLADRYKIHFAGIDIEEEDDSAWPSVDKAIGWGLWHLLDELGVKPTSTRINEDTNEPYNDYWTYRIERQVRGPGRVAPHAPAAMRAAEQDQGFPLPAALRQHYESALSTNLNAVRLHTGPTSDAAARAVDARAFTAGRDIHFAAGEYTPGTRHGDTLLAHELAHAAWAPQAPRRAYGLEVMPPGSDSERWAQAFAERAVQGA